LGNGDGAKAIGLVKAEVSMIKSKRAAARGILKKVEYDMLVMTVGVGRINARRVPLM
jgi:hypothetical protein